MSDRIKLALLVGFIMLFAAVMLFVSPAHAQVPADSTVSVVWPAAFSLKSFFLANQTLFAGGLTSLVLFLFAQIKELAALGNGIKIAAKLVIASVISFFVLKFGGTPDAALTALLSGGAIALVTGGIYQAGRNQPGS